MAAALAALLVLASATLTAAQAAAYQISRHRIATLQREGFSGADALAEVREIEPTLRASIRMITRTWNMIALSIGVVMGVEAWHSPFASALVILFGIAGIHLIVDVLPHVLAAKHPVRLALASAPALLLTARWTRWFTGPVERLEDRFVTRNGEEPLSTEHRELREIQELGEAEGVLEEDEGHLVERAFRFDELTAAHVMVPRVDIFAWSDDLMLSDVIPDLPHVPYTRVPIYHGSIDNITGVVYVREAYEHHVEGRGDVPLVELARSPFFIPGAVSLSKLLEDFRDRRIHMGIVADEFGGTDGIVTLQDVVDELVGEIDDETDQPEREAITQVSQTSLECDAATELRELNEALGIELPADERRTLNGFILEEIGHVPRRGDSFVSGSVRVDILDATHTQVVRARVTRLPEPAASV
ncbi:MAG: hemolysin family protein [Gemmatimonadales bacterium]